ncbi:MAG: TlpA family protein disulfide reductase, partial [Candidatus Acidiferrales bacterium]
VFPTWRAPSTKIMHDYGTVLIPDTYVIGRNGRIARKFVSVQKWDSPELLAYFDEILGQT